MQTKLYNMKKITEFQKSKAYNTIGAAYQYLGNYTEALEFFYKAMKMHNEENYKAGVSITLNNLASIYVAQNETNKTLELYKKAKSINVELNDSSLIPQNLNNIASIFLQKQQYDSSEYYFKIAYNLNKKNKNPIELARVSSNMGQLYLHTKDYKKSEKFINEAITIFSKTKNGKDLSISYQQKAQLLFAKGDINITGKDIIWTNTELCPPQTINTEMVANASTWTEIDVTFDVNLTGTIGLVLELPNTPERNYWGRNETGTDEIS